MIIVNSIGFLANCDRYAERILETIVLLDFSQTVASSLYEYDAFHIIKNAGDWTSSTFHGVWGHARYIFIEFICMARHSLGFPPFSVDFKFFFFFFFCPVVLIVLESLLPLLGILSLPISPCICIETKTNKVSLHMLYFIFGKKIKFQTTFRKCTSRWSVGPLS